MRRVPACFAFVTLAAAAGCAARPHAPRVVDPGPAGAQAELFDRVKSLEGTWTAPGPGGAEMTVVFAPTAGGTAMREIMFPGTDHEMTNLYHPDGAGLLVTHYCASGNQPRMRATRASKGAIEFRFDDVTNLRAADESFMGELTLAFRDDGALVETWRSLVRGAPAGEKTFTLTRKK